jgi:WD40 repeat protein
VISINDDMNIIRHETITDMHLKTNTAFCSHTIKNLNKDSGVFLVGSENKHVTKYNFDFRDYTFERVGSFLGHSHSVRSVTTNKDTTRLLSSCEDHSLRIWNYDTFEPLKILAGHKDNVVCC